jgi:hypothetical protein
MQSFWEDVVGARYYWGLISSSSLVSIAYLYAMKLCTKMLSAYLLAHMGTDGYFGRYSTTSGITTLVPSRAP